LYNLAGLNRFAGHDAITCSHQRGVAELQFSGSTQDQASNLLGSFFYNSLEDLEAERLDVTAAELVRLRFFAGLPLPEVAQLLGISPRTADRLWAYARAWLSRSSRSTKLRPTIAISLLISRLQTSMTDDIRFKSDS
jgi:hypothetical protein